MIVLVNPGAKERLVQITGSSEESINYAKLLIEDTIKRNASPIREASQEGSCSSLASSDDQQQASAQPRARTAMPMNQQQQNMAQMQMGNKLTRSNSNFLIHSLSSNDASLGEYKYTVNVGSHNLKITGDSLELVRVSWIRLCNCPEHFCLHLMLPQVAKLVLDDFFTNDEFLKSSEALTLAADAGSMIPLAHQLQHQPSPFIDSGVHLDLLARSSSNILAHHFHPQTTNEPDDDVFLHDTPGANDDAKALTPSPSIDSSSSSNTTVVTDQANAASNGLSRSRRSHFSRKDSTPEMANKTKSDREYRKRFHSAKFFNELLDEHRIVHSIKSLWWFYQNLPLCKAIPQDFDLIREHCPAIIREKVIDLMSILINGNLCTNNYLTNRVTYKNGSGRILKKAFSSFSSQYSKSFDEMLEVKHETNNKKSFRRSSSTICLNTLRESLTMAAHEA